MSSHLYILGPITGYLVTSVTSRHARHIWSHFVTLWSGMSSSAALMMTRQRRGRQRRPAVVPAVFIYRDVRPGPFHQDVIWCTPHWYNTRCDEGVILKGIFSYSSVSLGKNLDRRTSGLVLTAFVPPAATVPCFHSASSKLLKLVTYLGDSTVKTIRPWVLCTSLWCGSTPRRLRDQCTKTLNRRCCKHNEELCSGGGTTGWLNFYSNNHKHFSGNPVFVGDLGILRSCKVGTYLQRAAIKTANANTFVFAPGCIYFIDLLTWWLPALETRFFRCSASVKLIQALQRNTYLSKSHAKPGKSIT